MDLVRFRYGENNINTGPLKEIPEICVDHFLGNDLNSSVFFLTHAHTDHMVGLETQEFLRRLKQPGIKLYSHVLTPILLGSFNRYLGGPKGIEKLIADKKIVPLDVNKPIKISIPRFSGHLDVKVTLFPAGHCPGSVMFLFETSTVQILHTGDFRLDVEDLKRMPLLHSKGLPKKIDHLYIDTTFCCKSANLFPNRKTVLEEAFEGIKGWISRSKDHIVNLSFSAKFAHEYVLLEIHRIFNQKIHVTPERLEIYENIPTVRAICTLETHTQFHLCGNRYCVEDAEILTVRLSSMWYTKTKKTDRDSFILWRGPKNMTLCYSMHSSLDEIAKTIDYLKPKVVTPLVLPNKTDLSEVYSAIRSTTTSTFELEDYRSSRNDFEGFEIPAIPCNEERDETDEVDIDEANPCDDNDDVVYNCNQDDYSPAKRTKLCEENKAEIWEFKFSPSPSSKHSQSSSEDGSQSTSDGSQEISQETNHDFLKPSLTSKSINPRRNLGLTVFKTDDETVDSLNGSEASLDKYVIGDEDDDLMANSQRLV